MKRKKIVIIGGGFAGLNLARKLAKSDCEIILVDKQNHHMFQPLFYQVASARLEPSSISFPFRAIFKRRKNVEFRYATVELIRPEDNIIETSMGEIGYDELIIATGCKTNFFGNAELEKHTMAMKSTQQTIHIRNTILTKFEKIMFVENKQEQDELMNLVIVGAGPTGVELSGAFAEMKTKVLPHDYPNYDFSRLKIILLEGSPNTLNAMSDKSRAWSRKYLEGMGIDVRTSTVVSTFDGHNLTLKTGEVIPTQTVIWAAGVQGNVLAGLEKATMVRARYMVDHFSKIVGYENVYAIGDISYMETEKYPQGHPQLANVAINQGRVLANNFRAKWIGKKQVAFEYKDKGTMATVGKHKAVVELPNFKFQGYFAWMVWMVLHLMLILSVRNKIAVFFNWAWRYITGDTSLRLILRDERDRDNMRRND
ncbi:NAD(P)/FAD-dependent oxidoreductase [Fluviicola taffensis]|uniref:NADH:ubiquinone reductase (non-electrogenic) n=1 Tax=Fluviicola taffensis (strain DSM 16823 / NCIMB 13979 / RW262) TaxID=755732 RepID=F2IJC8_FLUTR|nr:NAD(P)/FAD-dependent oxidoreductase [Fluviicola taffensis]AEA46025.1 NADH dehydrogenase (ubiquinone) [Fluviicola taffensis DSM 16823]